jgi:hypothetical protein
MAKDGGVEVEVSFFGAGLNMLRKTNTAHEERLNIWWIRARRSLLVRTRFASQVDSAMAELTRKQEAGWAYIRQRGVPEITGGLGPAGHMASAVKFPRKKRTRVNPRVQTC